MFRSNEVVANSVALLITDLAWWGIVLCSVKQGKGALTAMPTLLLCILLLVPVALLVIGVRLLFTLRYSNGPLLERILVGLAAMGALTPALAFCLIIIHG